MAFFTIVIVMALLQFWGGGLPIQRDSWFHAWVAWLQKAGMLSVSAKGNIVVVALLPALLLAWVMVVANGLFLGLPDLVLSVLVLLYSLGRGNFAGCIEAYIEAWQRGDSQAAYQHIDQFNRGAEVAAKDLVSLHQAARVTVFYRGFERLFVVLFWFVLLGPAAALFYRLLFLYRHRILQTADVQVPAIARFIYWLEWLPVRLLGLSFCVLGNFMTGMQRWQALLLDTSKSSQVVLSQIGIAALCWDDNCRQLPEPPSDTQRLGFVAQGTAEIKAIQTLLNRAAILWIAVLAILTLLA